MQQIIVSGVGGQGVLFVTKLLAETALDLGYSVLVSETHGMAQRGGNVISHLKVAPREGAGGPGLVSPLIRPGRADVLLALHPDAVLAHGHFLKGGGISFRNTAQQEQKALNATELAARIGSPVSANLVLLGFAVASGGLFCGPAQIEATIRRLGGKRMETALKAFQAGCEQARK